jgi:hypothetical protein
VSWTPNPIKSITCMHATMSDLLNSPEEIAEVGERIYAERYKADLERTAFGHYVAIDVLSGNGYIGEFPEQALEKARAEATNGVFHLIKIGSAGAFRVSFSSRKKDTEHGFWGRSL